jgi:hypothetical protein
MKFCMQLALSYQALQMGHNILVPTWHNFQASRNSFLASLGGKHDPQLEIPYELYFYPHSFFLVLGCLQA